MFEMNTNQYTVLDLMRIRLIRT